MVIICQCFAAPRWANILIMLIIGGLNSSNTFSIKSKLIVRPVSYSLWGGVCARGVPTDRWGTTVSENGELKFTSEYFLFAAISKCLHTGCNSEVGSVFSMFSPVCTASGVLDTSI